MLRGNRVISRFLGRKVRKGEDLSAYIPSLRAPGTGF